MSAHLFRVEFRERETDLEERHPEENDVEELDEDHQQDERDERDDRNGEGADHPVRTRHRTAGGELFVEGPRQHGADEIAEGLAPGQADLAAENVGNDEGGVLVEFAEAGDRKSTRLNS